ncbi:MAG TPA: hypothetical protein VE967_00385, partial [Gemmatimonadaceae bacterium]|nr:hypothetical protein [Gemmatimonadaceae bacterium]
RAFRQLAMLLADHRRWHELATFARDHITRAPRDGWGFMVMGLAQHRIGNARVSAAAFDSAFAVLGDSVRKFLDRFERTLDTGQLHAFVANAPVAQKKIEASYWRNADPLWSVDGTEPRAEYLARVTFAQLRWGSDELTLDGVTSDFGNLYVRNGKWNAGWDGSFYFWRPSEVPADARQDICVPQVKPWFFAGDTRVPEGPAANWGSLAHGPIDSIQTQVARFRAAADSTDIFLATMPPIALIQRAASVKGPARSDLWLLANGTDDVAHDSVLPALPGVKTFIRRVSPGMYVYRTESSADGAVVTARATAGFIAGDDPRTGFSSRGFGMSDVLLASRVNAAPGAKRWSDYSVTPLVGPAIRKSSVTILWENYELGSTNGGASYTVTINIRQADTTKTLSGRIAAAVVGGIGSAIGVNRAKDRVEFTYDRSAPLAPVIADNITLSLNDTPAGKYLLTLRITDKATGKSAGRSQQLVIVDPSARPPVRR